MRLLGFIISHLERSLSGNFSDRGRRDKTRTKPSLKVHLSPCSPRPLFGFCFASPNSTVPLLLLLHYLPSCLPARLIASRLHWILTEPCLACCCAAWGEALVSCNPGHHASRLIPAARPAHPEQAYLQRHPLHPASNNKTGLQPFLLDSPSPIAATARSDTQLRQAQRPGFIITC
ncbi:hypothetical protein B0J15DRAFT_132697 [Fusarium solani]|jgi:hypothetical protein|uniref:Uncharacterized protein n=1 Tax=Fusarium solani TaxID=169388 RepID=A0A9P9RDX6_FUSSL|nr:uncharacterized protein B0J15DRAFT_132697 [Fusarium solani]KAH7274525.1 hypothetical protein B0J15DRAFT_132697 [Fusarium solani]